MSRKKSLFSGTLVEAAMGGDPTVNGQRLEIPMWVQLERFWEMNLMRLGSVFLMTITKYKHIHCDPSIFPSAGIHWEVASALLGYMLSWRLTPQGFYAPLGEERGQGYEQVNTQLTSDRELEYPERGSWSRVGGGVGLLIHLPSWHMCGYWWLAGGVGRPLAGLVSSLVTG